MGIVSVVLALLGFAVIPVGFGPLAVITGVVAVCKTRTGPSRGVAIAGLALGAMNLAIVAVQAFSMF